MILVEKTYPRNQITLDERGDVLNTAIPVNEFLGDNRITVSFPKGWEAQEYPIADCSAPLAGKQMRESFSQPIGVL